MVDDYDEVWMFNIVFDYYNENVKEEVIYFVFDVNKERGFIEFVIKVDKEGIIRFVYDGEFMFLYKEYFKF